jgi:hypothetical protein
MSYRVLRGGSYNRVSWNLRSTIRFRKRAAPPSGKRAREPVQE